MSEQDGACGGMSFLDVAREVRKRDDALELDRLWDSGQLGVANWIIGMVSNINREVFI